MCATKINISNMSKRSRNVPQNFTKQRWMRKTMVTLLTVTISLGVSGSMALAIDIQRHDNDGDSNYVSQQNHFLFNNDHLQRLIQEKGEKSNSKRTTSSPTSSPTAAPTRKQKTAKATNEDIGGVETTEQVFVSQVQESGVVDTEVTINNKKTTTTTNVPTISPSIPKLSRQAPTVPPLYVPPFLNNPIFASPTLVPTNQPMLAPTTAAPAPRPVPISVPAPRPVPIPVPAPVPSTVLPTASPAAAPVAVPVVVPSAAPSSTPSLEPSAETLSPKTIPSTVPSLGPTNMPSEIPSSSPTILNISEVPSSAPIDVKSMAPTSDNFIFMNITVNGVIEIQYKNLTFSANNVSLNDTEIMLLEEYTERWFNDFYNLTTNVDINDVIPSSGSNSTESRFLLEQHYKNDNNSVRNLHYLRKLQPNATNTTIDSNTTSAPSNSTNSISIRDMTTTITVQSSSRRDSKDIVVLYKQILQYYYLPSNIATTITSDASLMNNNSTTMENQLAEFLAIYPFRQIADVEEYRTILKASIVPTFQYVATIEQPMVLEEPQVTPTLAPIAPPVTVPVSVPAPVVVVPPVSTDNNKLGSGPIAGIAIICFLAVGLAVYGFLIYPHQRKHTSSAAAVAPADAFADNDFDDGKAKDVKNSTQDAVPKEETAIVMKSITTKQPNYAEETSTIGGFSDDGGASYEGKSIDTSDFDYNKVAYETTVLSGVAASNLAASTMSESEIIPDDNQFVIYAPAGKLGLVVDNPDDGAPVVHAIKDDSVLIGQIRVGDRLIGVDEVDVRKLSPVKVSKLISKRSSNPLRKLTLVRGKAEYDDETATDGGESSVSHTIESSSQVDVDDTQSGYLGIPPNPNNVTTPDDDETSHVESMSRLSGDEDEDGEEETVEEESVMDYPDDTSSIVDAMSHTSGYGGVDESKHDDAAATAVPTTTKVGEETSEQPSSVSKP